MFLQNQQIFEFKILLMQIMKIINLNKFMWKIIYLKEKSLKKREFLFEHAGGR
jgi:hypothetical protein